MSPEFKNSKLFQLEKMVESTPDFVSNDFKNTSISEQFHQDKKVNQKFDTSKAFLALVAPSMEGKTQSAFVFRSVKPLYFAFTWTKGMGSSQASIQPIYLNYQSLSKFILELAALDLNNIKEKDTGFVSSESIENDHSKIDLFVLGFLVELVNDANLNYGNRSSIPWMKYHAQRKGFRFKAISVSDISSGFFDGYCLFLDEFFGSRETVYLRNLARTVGLRTIVSNTNSSIVNLDGQMHMSGGNGMNVWSLVITYLDSVDAKILDSNFGLTKSILQIKRMGQHDSGVSIFLHDFVFKQVKFLRPGVAVYIADAFASFAQEYCDQQISLRQLLEYLITTLCVNFQNRKPILASQIDSTNWAHIGLLIPDAYDKSGVTDDEGFFHGYQFIENHLYYLSNPQNPDDWVFMTLPPAHSLSKSMQVISKGIKTNWNFPYTYFRKEELFTLIGCLFFPFTQSITTVLNRGRQLQLIEAKSVNDARNTQAIARAGNPLEVSTAVSIIDSSQHAHLYQYYSLGGQDGINFMKNLIENLIYSESYDKTAGIKVRFVTGDEYDLEKQFLSKCRIPFLYSMDSPIEILDKVSNLNSVFTGIYHRTSNSDKIDGIFKFSFDSHDPLYSAVVECKNLNTVKESINTSLLSSILKKSLEHENPLLCMVFCTKFIEEPSNASNFKRLCILEKINVYRISRAGSRSYEIVNFGKNNCKSPSLICIIFESNVINY
jgi:hypothetical protein